MDDFFVSEWSANGTNWDTVFPITNVGPGDWQYVGLALPESADDNPALWLRFRTHLSGATDRVTIDDVTFTGTAVPEPAGLVAIGALASLRLGSRRLSRLSQSKRH